ncbi:hypothetical protein NKR23_g11651 [Pleurostoma richardsiae]|uniref:Uncharacterized protein n=1 Tax=Pleurostoma richardsiae TaxID=41990 RepID=A0AA38VJS5_9PEZI|nr:hypothetical protein NKR23_g11651 [Pleurostoma richardsiae]
MHVDVSAIDDDFPSLREVLVLVFGDDVAVEQDIRSALLDFIHRIRFHLLQHPRFNELLDELPGLSVAMFGRMRGARDFRVSLPQFCCKCRKKTRPKSVLRFVEVRANLSLSPTCSGCHDQARRTRQADAMSPPWYRTAEERPTERHVEGRETKQQVSEGEEQVSLDGTEVKQQSPAPSLPQER